MAIQQDQIENVRQKYETIRPFLTEKGRRIWAAAEARAYGRGGATLVCKATRFSSATVHKGLKEIQDPSILKDPRIRKPGGGRKKAETKQKGLVEALEELVEPTAKGDPESPLRWTSKSLRNLAAALAQKSYHVSYAKVAQLLHASGYSLQVNKKCLEGSTHEDRDAQFRYINKAVTSQIKSNQPSISVDTKKKEVLGNLKNSGREVCKKGNPVKVNCHDFPDPRLGKVSPYGIYDIGKNQGWVSVGMSADTAEFAVNSIRTWWYKMGQPLYPEASKLVITADCGGSNGYRSRLWKYELQRFANESGLKLYIHHFPPGTSKWNKIEHRLFSYISKNWRGKPLLTEETVVNLIAGTKTETGLEVKAVLDKNCYEKGRKIADAELSSLNLCGMDFHPEWNYSISPHSERKFV